MCWGEPAGTTGLAEILVAIQPTIASGLRSIGRPEQSFGPGRPGSKGETFLITTEMLYNYDQLCKKNNVKLSNMF